MATPLTDFMDGEVILPSSTAALPDAIKLSVPSQMSERRIYLYVEVKMSTTNWFNLDGEIVCKSNGSPVVKLPARIADMNTGAPPSFNKSVASLLNAGGSVVGDSLTVQLANRFSASSSVAIIQPIQIGRAHV